VDDAVARERVSAARVGRLATVTAEVRPHVVPCCFVLDGDTLYSGVDGKPKSRLSLRRLDNGAADPFASLVVDHYDDDWSMLWWVRLDGRARVVTEADERQRALALLTEKYDQYVTTPPPGDVLAIDVTSWRAWP